MQYGNYISCLDFNFQCRSGELKKWAFRCDGQKHCDDGSDETECGEQVFI